MAYGAAFGFALGFSIWLCGYLLLSFTFFEWLTPAWELLRGLVGGFTLWGAVMGAIICAEDSPHA